MLSSIKSSGLALKIAFITCAASLLWIFIGTGTFLSLEYKKSKEELLDKVMDLGSTHAPGLAQSLWTFDDSSLQTQLIALTQLPSIASVTIKSDDTILYQEGKVKGQEETSANAIEKPIAFPLDYKTIDGDSKLLGNLEIVPDMEPVKKDLFSMVLQTLIVQSVDALVIALLILFLFYYLAGRHLGDIAQQASSLSVDQLNDPIQLKRKATPGNKADELGVLETALNNMRVNMINTFDELRYANDSLKQYAHIISSAQELMSFVDDKYVYQAVNDAYLVAHDKKRENIIGFSIPELMGEETFNSVVKPYFDRALDGETITFQEWFTYTALGKRYMNVTYNPFTDERNQITGVVVSVNDLTEHRLAEEKLKNLQNYLSNIIDSMPSILIGVDKLGKITQWNQKAYQETEVSPEAARGQLLEDILPRLSDELVHVKRAIKTGQIYANPGILRKEGDQRKYEDITVYPLLANGVKGAVIRIDDVTEQTRLEEMLVQNEKMLSVGGLAAGMAHEINNPLAGVLQTSEVMVNRLSVGSNIPANQKAADKLGISLEIIEEYMKARSIPRMLDNIIESARRMATIVENMLSFARKNEVSNTLSPLEELIDKSLKLAATDYNLKKQYDFKATRIIRDFTIPSMKIPCEPSKIQQVLLNIFKNGAEAMQEAGGTKPVFTIRTWLDENRQMACIAIKDNGPGMEEAIRKRIFEPFFTTKPEGEGTGLGLSVSYFIIKENHAGEMSVESSPGDGTEFFIYLPVNRKEIV